MKVFLSPQVHGDRIDYAFNGETITATIGDQSDTFDLSLFPEGGLFEYCETDLPHNPIVSIKRIDGTLLVELLHFIPLNATDQERFPNWQEV